MRKLVFLLLLAAIVGCKKRPQISSSIQPAEFDVYHAYVLRFTKAHPDEKNLYVFDSAGYDFLTPDDTERSHKLYDQCLPPEAQAAFLALGRNSLQIGSSPGSAWRTGLDGKVLPYLEPGTDWPKTYTRIYFSRVFFKNGGQEGYLDVSVGGCVDGVCGGGGSDIWHAVRSGDSWVLNPTKCWTIQ